MLTVWTDTGPHPSGENPGTGSDLGAGVSLFSHEEE